jgi:hypothetical protein
LRRSDVSQTLLLDFQNGVLNSPRLRPVDGQYAKPREDRLRILNFMESEIHKLRRSYQRMIDYDLKLIHEFITQKFEAIRRASSDIFNEYLDNFQKRMTGHCLSVLNLDQGFASPNATNMFKKKTRLEANDFLNYKILHSDSKALVKFMNKNLELKVKFLAETRKGGTEPDMNLRHAN